MNLDKLTIEIRPRQAWEAVDLGVLMARRWWWSLTKAWLLVSAPVWLLLCLLPTHLVVLQTLIIWWLKPLFERPLLHILSQAVFDAKPTTRQALGAFPRLAGIQVFASLLWRRFSPTRSMDLPVIQLEGLKGQRRAERLRILHREDSGPAPWITIFGMHMEAFIVLAVYILVLMFWPQVLDLEWNDYLIEQKYHWFTLLQNFLVYAAMTLVAPFYVACGFALYLNRRIRLEAWDLEIAFKNIVQKRQSRAHGGALAAVLPYFITVCFALSCATAPESAMAQKPDTSDQLSDTIQAEATSLPPAQVDLDRESAREIIEEIKAGDAFHEMKTIKVPDLSWLEFDEENDEPEGDLAFLKAFFQMIAQFGQVILWLAVIFFVLFVVFRYRDWLGELALEKSAREKRVKPKTLFGLDLTEESLPEDISASACELWNKNRPRDCLSLLYRASLMRLIHKGLDIRDGDTEQECLEQARKHRRALSLDNDVVDYFGHLTRLWRLLAYGHIPPDEKEALALCKTWNTIWLAENNHDR